MASCVADQGVRALASDGGRGADLGQAALPADRLSGCLLLLRAQVRRRPAEEPGRGRPGASQDLREARHPAQGAGDAGRGRRRRGVRQRLGGDHLQGQARRDGHHLLLDLGGGEGAPRAGAALSRLGRALFGQLLRDAQLGGLHRRLLRLRAEGRALPDGAFHLLPHQRRQHGPVRAHPHHRRRGLLRELPGRVHRADAGREPASRGGRRAGGAGRRRDQVLHGAELVSGRCRGQGRDLQLRHQARRLPRRQRQDLVDPGGDRVRDHLEVPELHPAGRQLGRRVLLHRHHQQTASRRTPAPR